jgi:uncharacterized protein DUF6982
MSHVRAAASLASAPAPSIFDVTYDTVAARAADRGSDRRAHARLTPAELSARLKYGEEITLVDVSVGGALVETSRILRPDTNLVLEILDVRTKNVTQMVSRVLRAHVAGVDDGIRYRGACAFKRPLSHPALVAAPPPPPLLQTDARDFLKLEFALKTIVEGYFRRPAASGTAGRWRDTSTLLDALVRLRAAAERRDDPSNRQLAQLLGGIIPALQRQDSPDAMLSQLQAQLSRQLPLLAIRASGQPHMAPHDRELVTLNMATDADQPRVAMTAEFPAGFALNETQFRVLKAGAYLVGLVGHWRMRAEERPNPMPLATPPPAPLAAHAGSTVVDEAALPISWQRVVVRYVDGQLLRGYSNDFHPDRAHLHLSPTVNCPASERLLVPLSRLKAVFFVKALHGDPERLDAHTFDHSPRGRKIEATFRDGEMMLGSTLSYKPNGLGLYLQPANSRGNNVRIYVVMAALRHMRFV